MSSVRLAEPVRPERRKRLIRRVAQADPGQEYLVYIPSTGGMDAPMLVTIHGISRNADEHARLFSAYCEMYGVVLVAPVFSKDQHPDYQRLGRLGHGKRTDVALNAIVAEAAALTGAHADQFYLFGFSGGAQFAHRYAMAYPHRVHGAAFASAGWYTMPEPRRKFPYGTRQIDRLPGVRFDAEDYLNVPMHVFIGADDDDPQGVRHTLRLDREQGISRLERARTWVAAMKTAAQAHHLDSQVHYEELPGCDHSFKRSVLRGGLGDKVFEALLGAPQGSTSAEDR